jgi:transcriptional regulator with XRE-family HTH domain
VGSTNVSAENLKGRLIELLLAQRRAQQLTQGQLAQRSGVAQTEISRIERGRKTPTLDTYTRLAAALGLDVGRRLAVEASGRADVARREATAE